MSHQHTLECLEEDVEDMTNASGGDAWVYFSCRVTGESHRTVAEFKIEED